MSRRVRKEIVLRFVAAVRKKEKRKSNAFKALQ
jgi:hypothetical protein